MNHWSEVESLLSSAIADFLNERLPQIGGTQWWQNHVIMQLTPSQAIVAKTIESGDIRALDLAALLRVTDRNWSELAFRHGLSRSTRTEVKLLQGARNRHAHRPVNGVPLADMLKDVATTLCFLKAISANARAITKCEQIHRELCDTADQGVNEESPLISPITSVAINDSFIDDQETSKLRSANQNCRSTGGWLIDTSPYKGDLDNALADTTYIGIDFGTSTTVVSFAYMDADQKLTTDTLKLAQPKRDGGTVRHHLVNSVLAYTNKRILFGLDAHQHRPKLLEGRSVFTSFKMQLGVDIGPTYPRSLLRRGYGPIVIESASDATTEFFKLVHAEIVATVAARRLHPNLKFAISVPASFEANQRRALIGCAEKAGLNVDLSCLIDEPNAAFLSFMSECIHRDQDVELANQMKGHGLNILVYDFGAGTCDVSVLHIALPDGKVQSRNLAISKFAALGGDDIDRAIAKEVLVPQLLATNIHVDLTETKINESLIPMLMPTAERLKVTANKWLADRKLSKLEELTSIEQRFSDHPFSLKISRDQTLHLQHPSVSIRELADLLHPFLKPFDEIDPGQHVFSPIDDALSKSGLSPFELDAVLFIGGSAKSPLVRHCVMQHLPPTVRPITPRDLQSHVSTGAAIHSLGFHGFAFNIVEPITSEPIFVITRGRGRETIIPASTRVPSRNPFVLTLTLERDDQKTVELPICVSSESKLLGLLRLDAPDGGSFSKGVPIHIEASITADKILVVKAAANGVNVTSSLLNPLANKELSHAESRLLEARQEYNIECLEAGGRPPKEAVIKFALAAERAGVHVLAADLFVQVDTLPGSGDHASNICYSYARAGRHDLSRKWAKIAYERRPCALTAYNMSCRASDSQKEKYLREALRYNPSYDCALVSLGSLLASRGDDEGNRLIASATQSLEQALEHNNINASDCERLAIAARLQGDKKLAARAKARKATLTDDDRPFDDDNLADSSNSHSPMENQ